MKTPFPLLGMLPVLSCAFCIAFAALGEDWTHWRGPDNDGVSSESGWLEKWPEEGPKQLWKTSVGIGFSSFAVSQGKLYTMGHDGKETETIYCLDAGTGAKKWTKNYNTALDPNMYEGGPNSTPTVDGDTVFTLGKHGQLFCLKADSGEVVWSKDLKKDFGQQPPMWGFACSPVVEGDLLILNSGASGLAINKATGALAWKSEKDKAGYATALPVTLNGKPAIFLMAAKALFALNPADGKPLWSYPWKTEWDINAADPVFNDGKVFISSGYDHGCALVDVSGASPKQVWENKSLMNHFSSSVLWKGFLYGVNDDGDNHEFTCLSWETGKVKWSKDFGRASLMIAGGKIIALNEHGELHVIDPSPEAFKSISHAQVLGGKCWTVPVLSNGHIYCRNAKGDTVCLDVSGK